MDILTIFAGTFGKFWGSFIAAAGAAAFSLLVSIVVVSININKNVSKLASKVVAVDSRVSHISDTAISTIDLLKPVLVTVHTILDISTDKVQNGNVTSAYNMLKEAEEKYQDTLLQGMKVAHDTGDQK